MPYNTGSSESQFDYTRPAHLRSMQRRPTWVMPYGSRPNYT
jgi:hypothetical protein